MSHCWQSVYFFQPFFVSSWQTGPGDGRDGRRATAAGGDDDAVTDAVDVDAMESNKFLYQEKHAYYTA